MTTWAEYQTKLADWSKSPSPADIPWNDLALMAYQRVSREIQPAELDTLLTIDTEQGVNIRSKVWSHAVPSGFLRAISLTNNGCRVRPYNTGALLELEGSQPYGHAVVGQELWVAPGVGGDLKLIYNKRDTLPSEIETNQGLTDYLDAYIHAGLVAYYQYVEDMENEMRALERFNARADTLNMIANDQRRGAGAGGVR